MIDAQKRKTIYGLHQQGHPIREIARLMQVDRKTVDQIIKQQG